MISTREARDIMMIKASCVRRSADYDCNRHCEACDLYLPDEKVLEAYSMAFDVLDIKMNSDPMRLKSCPFCGAEAAIQKNYLGQFSVACVNPACHAIMWGTDGQNTEELVVALWNRRNEPCRT